MSRPGFSLVELVIALVLLGLVSSVVYRLVAHNTRVYRTATQRIDGRQSLRAAATILPAELRELDATEGDIHAMSSSEITFRATRQLAFLCDWPRPGTVLAVRERLLFGTRDFNPDTDSLLVYYAVNDTDEGWVAARLRAVAAGTCADGEPARLLTVALPSAAGALAPGAPVRGFEVVTYRLYKGGDGQWQIGLLDGRAGGVQPVVGPVAPNGIELLYRDSAGAFTASPSRVATIEIRLRAPPESAAIVVALRNNRRS